MTDANQTIHSFVEIIEINSGERCCILRARGIFEAPNWSRDGSFLLLNHDGLLYRLTLADSALSRLDTGFATRCNNDHGISPDGNEIVISHHDHASEGGSVIYILPLTGGEPRRVTAQWPSYWHGWSPDGETLAYVAGRGGDYKIYTISTAGGQEHQLTFGPGLDDGPDYSPDGRYIYFNGFRDGRMQIWRLPAHGGEPEKVVSSAHSDWFPHPSPDGAHLVFLRYLEDQGQAHPFGRDVQLILLNLHTGTERPLTDVFWGGQGTLNVPSWAPDGQRLAFISYTKG